MKYEVDCSGPVYSHIFITSDFISTSLRLHLDLMPDPLDEIQWKSPEWIQQFGLHTGNVLDYFSESPFYDRTSNNQVLRMQFQFQAPPANIHPQRYIQDKLTEMTGIEFVIAYMREPDFWVIRKQNRTGPESTITEQDFYIIGANVYQAPKVYDLLSSRLLSSVLSIKTLVGLLNQMSKYSISDGGHVYPSVNDVERTRNSTHPTTSVAATGNGAGATPMKTPSVPASVPGTVPATVPGTIPGTGLLSLAQNEIFGMNPEVSVSAFSLLLAGAVSGNDSIYLDDVPTSGKGSTINQMNVRER